MNMRSWLAATALAALAGCSALQPPLPDHPDAVAAIEAYYRAHAWEEGARCLNPSMRVTQAKLLEDGPGRQVVEARYYWNDAKWAAKAPGFCSGFSTRTFTLEDGRVTDMSGEQRR